MRPAILALAYESGHAKQRSSGDSASAQNQRLDGKQQGLDAQQHRMHEADGVDGMQHKTLECAGLLRSNQVVVAGIGVDDATASGRNAIKVRGTREWCPSFAPAALRPVARHPGAGRLRCNLARPSPPSEYCPGL